MRQLRRPKPHLPTLHRIETDHGQNWKGTKSDGPTGAEWRKPDVRGALIAMHGRVCAYCQSELRRGDRGDVDHFRPRSLYRWLTYDFRNFLLSCLECNRTIKRSLFPLRPRASHCTYARRKSLAREARLLLDPSVDEIDAWVTYDIKKETCPIVPMTSLPPKIAEMVEATIRFFRLNLETVATPRLDLIADRIRIMREAGALLLKFEAGERDLATEIKVKACRFLPHGLVARKVLEVAGRQDLLPTPEEELEYFLHLLKERVDWLMATASAEQQHSESWQQLHDELAYTLATLWVDPPALDSERVGVLLAEFGLAEWVAPYRDRLTPRPRSA